MKSTKGRTLGCWPGELRQQLLHGLGELQVGAIQDAVGIADVADLLGA